MNKAIFGSIILLCLAALVVQQQPTTTSQDLPDLPTFVLADVTSFTISEQDNIRIHGKWQGDQWYLGQAQQLTPLKDMVVSQLLADLQMMSVKRVASHKPENHARFSVTDSGVKVLLQDMNDKTLLSIIIGKPATDLRSTYIRISGHNTVMTVNKILTWQVKRTPDAWLAEVQL